jgi:hypothetical protein
MWQGVPSAKYSILIGSWAVSNLQCRACTDLIVYAWTAKMDRSQRKTYMTYFQVKKTMHKYVTLPSFNSNNLPFYSTLC